MPTTTTTEAKAEKTPGKPCSHCGCPYPGDHTLDCPMGTPREALLTAMLREAWYLGATHQRPTPKQLSQWWEILNPK